MSFTLVMPKIFGVIIVTVSHKQMAPEFFSYRNRSLLSLKVLIRLMPILQSLTDYGMNYIIISVSLAVLVVADVVPCDWLLKLNNLST